MKITLTEEQINQLLAYLGSRPYVEVQKLIETIMTAPKIEEKKDEES